MKKKKSHLNRRNVLTLNNINKDLSRAYIFARCAWDQDFCNINTWINYKSWIRWHEVFFQEADKELYWYPF